MIETKGGRPLIVAVGNHFRMDDGAAAETVRVAAVRRSLDCDVLVVHGLVPELAEAMASARRTLVIDAAIDLDPGEVRIESVVMAPEGRVTSHHWSVERLMETCRVVFGRVPLVDVLKIGVADLGHGEGLSPEARRATSSAADALTCWLHTVEQEPVDA